MPDIGTRRAKVFIDSTEYTAAVKKAVIRSAESDSDFMSFEDAANGGLRDYALALILKQDTAADSLWDLIWSQSGADLDVEFWPNGQNSVSPTTPTTTYPRFDGTVTITDPDGDLLGGEAKPSNTAKQVTEVEWKFTAKPTRVTA